MFSLAGALRRESMKLIIRIGVVALVLALAAHCSLGQTPAPEKTASTKPALA